VVIADMTKDVDVLSGPVPLEVLAFGLQATLAEVAPAQVREGAMLSPDGNMIADYLGAVEDPTALAARLDGVPGVVGHGLFAAALVSDVLIGRPDGVEHRPLR
jgi:ribose 5-phosphate isomerase A